MGGGGGAAPDSIFYVKGDSDKFKVLPFAVTVLIEQDRVQDFLVELENSPMWIQVKDFDLVRPSARVMRPEKGEPASSGLMSGGMGGRMGMGMGMGGMVGMGGMAGQMENQMRTMMESQRGMMQGMSSMPGMSGMGQPDSATRRKGRTCGTPNERRNARTRKKVSKTPRAPRFSIRSSISFRSRSTGRRGSSMPRPRTRRSCPVNLRRPRPASLRPKTRKPPRASRPRRPI